MYDEWFMIAYENNKVPKEWLEEAEQASLAKLLPRTNSGPALWGGWLARLRAGRAQLATAARRAKEAGRSWFARPPTPGEQCC